MFQVNYNIIVQIRSSTMEITHFISHSMVILQQTPTIHLIVEMDLYLWQKKKAPKLQPWLC